jgi:Tfp pilus assembly protein PilF
VPSRPVPSRGVCSKAWLCLVLLAACQSAPVSEKPGGDLEIPSTEQARQELQAAGRQLASGQAEEALDNLTRLARGDPGCADLTVQENRALNLLPGEKRRERELALSTWYRDRSQAEEAKGGQADLAVRANLFFAMALHEDSRDKRRKQLQRALELRADHYYARTLLGETLWSLGRIEDARKQLIQALKDSPFMAEAWLILAQIAEDNGRYRSADRNYSNYLRLRPWNLRVKNNYARLLVHFRRNGVRAEKVIAELLAVDPENAEYQLHLAASYWYQARFADAEKIYKHLARLYPDDARVFLGLGELYEEPMKKPAKALQVYRWLLQLPPSPDPFALIYQSLPVYIRIQRLEETLGEKAPAKPERLEDVL